MNVLAFIGAAAPSIITSLVVGVIGAVAVLAIGRANRSGTSFVAAFIVGLVVSLIAFGALAIAQAYTPVDYGTVAVVARFGGLTGTVFEPGLHWRTPFIDKLVIVPTLVRSYETSEDPYSSEANYTDIPVTAQTIDGQQIQIKYTVLFRIPPEEAVNIVQNIGFIQQVVENVVKAHSRNLSRLWAQRYTAEELFSGVGIFEYQDTVIEALTEDMGRYGIVLDDFLVRKVDFDEEYIRAIEQQQIAQEAIETASYNAEAAEYERDRQIRLSEADAQRISLLAESDAERQRLLADSEAYSIQVRGEALQEFPEVIQWEFVVNLGGIEWGILPSDGITPLIPIPSFGETEQVLPQPGQ